MNTRRPASPDPVPQPLRDVIQDALAAGVPAEEIRAAIQRRSTAGPHPFRGTPDNPLELAEVLR